MRTSRAWLQQKHGLGSTTAMGIAAPRIVEAMYEDKKAHLRPIHEAVVGLALDIAPDPRICPTKAAVPFYRNHVIANLRPTTQKRVDLGLCIRLAEPPASDRVIPVGGKGSGDRINYRIPLQDLAEVDELVSLCLAMAYSEDT
ncbi:MAG: hypothetical protein ACI9W4_001561 [Rhodothermales bacterium]|jgi:hypothetical protein